jgi:GNAT superfamily N-acetyltransferase
MDLLSENDLMIGGLDWSDIGDDWWVAIHKDDIVGCVQVLFGKPLGVINFLAVDPKFHKSGLGVQLFRWAEILLSASNCDGFLAATYTEAIINRAEDLGLTKLGQPTVFVKRVYRYAKDSQKNNYRH